MFQSWVKIITATLLFVFSAVYSSAQAKESEHVLVVCPQYFRESLQPWVEHRTAQGYTIHILTENNLQIDQDNNHNFINSVVIREAIRRLAEEKLTKHLMIVGSAVADGTVPANRVVPTEFVEAKVIQHFGRDEFIPSDNSYADLDGDGVADIPCGRIPARTKEELDAVVKKIIRYETAPKNSEKLRRMNFIAGVGGFSQIIDSAIESTARLILDAAIPAGFDLSMTQASWKSPYCPNPFDFRAETINRMSEGSLFWVYIGHGHAERLDTVGTPLGHFPIWLENDSEHVKCTEIPPIAVFLACHTGAFDREKPSIAESLAVKDDGPVAVVGATRTTMPYAMAVFSIEFIEELFQNQPETLGMLVLNAKRNMIAAKSKAEQKRAEIDRVTFSSEKKPQRPIREMLESVAKLLDPTAERLGDQLGDHLHLFHLLGDHNIIIPTPKPLAMECPERAKAGETAEIRGRTKIGDGNVIVELAIPRIRASVPNPRRPECVLDETQRAEFTETYQKANDRVLSRVQVKCVDGEFTALLPIPKGISGEHTVRIFVQGTNSHAIGAKPIEIRL